ncbi:MAG: prolyl oligopeptidase family serine peptidase [Candidatus Poribacteria bacterium]|nr:prolyl oligopeptidase family serine peptidase [Candidatus Poribacteria bacterium]
MHHEQERDTLAFTHQLYAETPRQLAFQATTVAEAEAWQVELRAKLSELVGGFPQEKCDLQSEVMETREFPSYVRETVQFKSRPHSVIFGYFLSPKPPNSSAPNPTILCLAGHGRGVDDIVGIEEDGSMRETFGGYQNDFALQCLAHGYSVLAIEQFGFGHRRDAVAHQKGGGNSSCQPSAGAALLLGHTMVGWRVYDAMRAFDYLATRPEVDMNRLGIMGISGGGTTTFFTAAIDTRVKAAVVSGYFNTFRDSILSLSHCIDNYIPNVLQYAEMYDIAGLIAPRALFIESGTEDTIFPIEATRFAVNVAKAIFNCFNAGDKLGFEVFEAGHSFHGVGAFEFLKQAL